MKQCKLCDQQKSDTEFGIDRHVHDGKSNRCLECMRRYSKIWKQNPVIKAKQKNDWLKREFGIDLEQYRAMALNQNKKCAICKTEETDKLKRSLAVDHDHKTGRIRGLLCSRCNKGLGLFKDDLELLRSALLYLEEKWPAIDRDLNPTLR